MLVRTQIAIDDPVPESIFMLDWCEYVTESVPGCHGDGDPRVVGPTIIRLLQSFTRARVPADILRKITDVAGKQLCLLAKHDVVAFGLLVAELVDAVGDLFTIATQWGAVDERHDGAEDAVFLVFLDRFGRSWCGETETVRVKITTADQAWSGVLVVLRCLWQYARNSCQRPQNALHPCASELWAHLGRVAGDGVDDETRDVALRLVEFLLCHSVFPDFVDSALDVLAEMLSTPDADFWQFEAVADDAEEPEPTRREVIVRCLGHGISRAVQQSPTPPHPAQFAEIMPRLLTSARTEVSVKVEACRFFSDLLQQSSAALEGSHTAQLVDLLGTVEEPLRDGIVKFLQVAVAKRMPAQAVPQKRGADAVDSQSMEMSQSSAAAASAGQHPAKRRRRSSQSSQSQPELSTGAAASSEPGDLIVHSGDVLLQALQNCLATSLRPSGSSAVSSGQRLTAAAACLQIFLGQHMWDPRVRGGGSQSSVVKWDATLKLLDEFLKGAVRPVKDSRKVPERSFVAMWNVAVDLLAQLLWQLPEPITNPFMPSWSQSLSLPLTQETWRDSRSAAMSALVSNSARAFTLAFPDGESRLSAETMFMMMQSSNIAQVVEAAKLCPFVTCTAVNTAAVRPQVNIKTCFTHLSKTWTSALRARATNPEESTAVLLATLNSLGPLCCIFASKADKSTVATAHEKHELRARTYSERQKCTWCYCTTCDGDRSASGRPRIDVLSHVSAFAKDIAHGTDLPSSVMLAFAHSTARVLQHMSERDLQHPEGIALVKAWLALLTHESKSVREAIVETIGVVTADDCLCTQQLNVKQSQSSQGGAASQRRPQAQTDRSVALLMHIESQRNAVSVEVWESMLRALGQLARYMSNCKILVAGVLKRLLVQLTLLDAPPLLRVTAYQEINGIACSKYPGMSATRAVTNIVREMQGELYPGLLMEWFGDNTNTANVAKMITGITTVLEVKAEDFHRDLLRISLPTLIRYKAPWLIDVVKYFATLQPGTIKQWPSNGKQSKVSMQEKLETLVAASLHEVLVEGMLRVPAGTHSDFLDHLSKSVLKGRFQVVDLHGEIRSCCTEIVDAAVWEMGQEDTGDPQAPVKRAVDCLDFVATCEPGGRGNVEKLLVTNFPLAMEQINSVLDPDIKAPAKDSTGMIWITRGTDRDGCHALRSLRNVIELMGNSMKKFLPVVISTLKKVLERKGLQTTALTVWSMLVHKVPAKLFGPYLCQIVGHLMDVIDEFPKDTVAILDHLLDSNKQELRRHFHELPFLPRIAPLERLNKIIDAEIGKKNPVDRLHQLLQGVYNDSAKVRSLALTRLREELRLEWKDLSDLVGGPGQQIHSVIDLMVAALRRGCTDMDPNVRTLSMECFGELGAIDPTKLPPNGVGADAPVTLSAAAAREHASKSDRSSRHATVSVAPKLEDVDMVAELMNLHLVSVVKAAQGAVEHDRAAFAIQEVLKLVGLATSRGQASRSGMSNIGEAVWKKLTEPTKTLVSRFKETKYNLTSSSSFKYAGYWVLVRQDHQRWVRNWAYHLTVNLQSCKKAPEHLVVYHACRAVTRMDMPTATFLLPYLVWDTVCWGTEDDLAGVSEQIIGVLKMELSDAQQVAQCQQVLFSLLDRLRSWIDLEEKKFTKRRASEDRERVDQIVLHVRKVRDLLEFIPKSDLARAALQCKAFQRALLNFEQEVRTRGSEAGGPLKLDATELAFLQKVYVGLNDSDGLAGVASTRGQTADGLSGAEDTQTALRAQIVDHEAAGRWVDATTCYSVLLQSMDGGSKDSELNDGLMRCMRELGHFHAVLTHAQGTIKACSSPVTGNKRALECGVFHAADAAWRLGEWDVIEDLSKYKADNTHLSVGIGNILRQLEVFKSSDDEAASTPVILEECNAMRQRIGKQLSAACMESYERAYPLICELHQLQELEHACRSSLFESEGEAEAAVPSKSLIRSWSKRLDMMQPQLRCREPVLALRRALLQIARDPTVDHEIGNTWIELAQTARGSCLNTHGAASDPLHTAAGALMQQTAQQAENFHIEKAKLSWAQNNRHQAVTELTAAVLRMGGTMPEPGVQTAAQIRGGRAPRSSGSASEAFGSPDSQLILAKMQLLLGKYGQQTSQHSNHVVHHFVSAAKKQQAWDKAFFYLARYHDMMYTEAAKQQALQEAQPDSTETEAVRISAPAKKQKVVKADKLVSAYERLPDVIHNYGRALCLGHKYLFRCLPRMLTLWFELSEYMHDEENTPKPAGSSGSGRYSRSSVGPDPLQAVFVKVDAMIKRFKDELPTYQWFTSLPQLISRSTHPNKATQQLVKEIIGHILARHPTQAVWIVMPATKSKNPLRANIANDIVRYALQNTTVDGGKTIQAADKVIQELIHVCKHKTQDRYVKEGLCVSQHFPELKRVLSRHGDGRVLMPTQAALTVVLPDDRGGGPGGGAPTTQSHAGSGGASMTQQVRNEVRSHKAFPHREVLIELAEEKLQILNSLMKPSRLTLRGTDGETLTRL